jgi:PAS domain S-box-containing protein
VKSSSGKKKSSKTAAREKGAAVRSAQVSRTRESRAGTDVSRRKLAEDALRESEERERLRSLLKHAMIGFFIAQDGKIAFMNPEQEKLFGQVPESMNLEEFAVIHPEDRAGFLALCREDVSAGSGSGPVDIRLFRPGKEKSDREVRWVHCRGTTISWGGRKAILVNMLDVTRTRELERIALVQEKMIALGHVAAGIAHEIRNPLSGINIYLSSLEQVLLQSGSVKAEEKDQAEECLRHLKTASAKISSVVQRVMAFSRPIPPTFEMANVNQAIEDAVAISAVTLRTHGVELTKILPEGLPKCYADPRLLEQVILNLITNADQAMNGMKVPKRLEIRSFRDSDGIVIKVSDSGPGVPPQLRERIFDPYFTTRSDGTGIGLSFSNRVITVHGGVLSVGESPLGGAEFRIRLPLRARRTHE